MRTHRSVRTSPLAYDLEVERSAMLRRKAVRQFFINLDFAGLKELFTEMSNDDVTGAESPPRGVDSYYRPGNFEDPSPTVYPAAANGAVSNFKIQPNLIAILPMFRGHEEPYTHLREFFSIADTYRVNNTTKDDLAEKVHKREAGKLPSYPDLNPKHKPGGPEHVNMVTSLRNGKTYKNDIKIPRAHDFSQDVKDFVTDDEIIAKATESPKVGEGGVSSTTTPYPAALEKSASTRLAKNGPYTEDMWETFKQVKINLPLIDAIKQIPVYAKFLKDLCTQKRKLKATLSKKIDLTEHVNAVLFSFLPPKFKDPRAPLISVVVGNIAIKKALLDLGASINIIRASLVDKYDLGTLRKTDTIISLTDRSTKIPRGILEDVIVKVDDFYYPVDFFVMDTESPYKDVQPTIILGRPFLAMIDAKINCRTGVMDIAFGNKKLRLNMFNSVNSPTINECYQVDVIDEEVQKHAPRTLKDDPLELYLTDENEEILDIAERCLQLLKPLPSNLKYAFLGHNNTLPVIVASDLSGSQKESLLKVISMYKVAVGWTIANLKGISSSLCMHRILTDPDVKPSKDAQRHLNPNMKEVVKKEVLKWLDAGNGYNKKGQNPSKTGQNRSQNGKRGKVNSQKSTKSQTQKNRSQEKSKSQRNQRRGAESAILQSYIKERVKMTRG
nr:hypothetical protein [Tanacetum cinerariifolium]